MAFNIWKSFSGQTAVPLSSNFNIIYEVCIGWGVMLPFVGIAVALHFTYPSIVSYSTEICWLSTATGIATGIAIPLCSTNGYNNSSEYNIYFVQYQNHLADKASH